MVAAELASGAMRGLHASPAVGGRPRADRGPQPRSAGVARYSPRLVKLRDADIRSALRARTARLHADDAEARLIEELDLGPGARADVVVLNGRIEGYEIKSDVDSLARLAHQAAAYEAICDRVWIVTTDRLASAAEDQLPSCWGILIARNRADVVQLVRRRAARAHRGQRTGALVEVLWRSELVALNDRLGLPPARTRTTAPALRRTISEACSARRLASEVRRALLLRADWRAVRPSVSGDVQFRPSARWSSSRSRLPAHRLR